ncbi:MAG: IS66 family insertion sequence element accessory protein TnpB [Gammaproteobacteria bacterium]|nr:IS66 family insertion sequence element accessory protein TnpB [Gammaproteobacteria bacterium]
MLSTDGVAHVYLAAGHTDMRKSIDGLAVLVSAVLEQDPLSSHWFVFCNRHKDKLKILHWDHNGFWLYYRRLERGRFAWPEASDASAVCITVRQLRWLLDGLRPQECRGHRAVSARTVI